MTGTRKILLLIAVLGLAGGAARHFGKPAASPAGKTAKTPPVVPVKLARALVRDMPLRLEITGRTAPYETVTLRSRVDGQVRDVAFTEGRQVKQGEVLLRLDPADFQARLNQAEANLAKSQTLRSQARADLERYIALRAKGFVSEEKVAQMRTLTAAAEAAVKADAAAMELARLQLSYTTIKSPFSGVVGARLVFPGAAARVNDTALAVVNRVRPLSVGFAVPEKYLPRLQAGMRSPAGAMTAVISVPGDATPREGDVRFLDHSVDAASGTIQLKAVLANDDERLAPGQFVNVSLVLDTLKDAVIVPAEAVQQGSDGAFLFVVKNQNRVEIRKIRVASIQRQLAIVAEGLAAGETVVTEGQLRLTADSRIQSSDAPAGNPGKPDKPGKPN